MIYFFKFFCCGVLTALLFPPFFLFPLGFILLPYLFFLISKNKIINKTKITHFNFGFFYGLGLSFVILIWIKEPFLVNSSTINLSYISYLLVAYVSIYFGLSFFILSFFKNKFSKFILLPIVFVMAEILRENIFFGFPWITFALVSSSNIYFLNLAYYIGTNGLSLITLYILLIPVSLLFLIFRNKNTYYFKIYLILILVTLFISILFITYRLNKFKEIENYEKINLNLNQLNIKQIDRSNPALYKSRLQEILEIVSNNENEVIIFSENDYPYLIRDNSILDLIQENIDQDQIVIIGGIKIQDLKYYNTLYTIKKNEFTSFDKKILVPFGEFLPFRKFLNTFGFITGNIDFDVGTKKRNIALLNNLNFIPIICYEIIFFNDLIDSENSLTPIIVNLTNDAWFGKLSGPYQHFYLTRLRSVEFNKYVIRSSNNGVSALIDNYGTIFEHISLNTKKSIALSAYVPKKLENNIYIHQFIYLFIFLILYFAIFINLKNE